MSTFKSVLGFTLIELLMVISIIAIVGAATIPIGSAFLVRNYLGNKTAELTSSLRTAQINSLNGKEDQSWGVEVSSNSIRLFAATDSNFDQLFAIPGSISITPGTVMFDPLTGDPDQTFTFTISSNAGDTKTVSVNQVGTVNVN